MVGSAVLSPTGGVKGSGTPVVSVSMGTVTL